MRHTIKYWYLTVNIPLQDQLEAERNDVMLAKVTMEATISQLQGRSEGLHGEVKDQKVKVSEMAAKCDGLQSEKTKLMTEKEGDREEIERLGRNLADAITEKDEGQAMFVSLEAELKAMSENLNQMQKELEEKLSQQEKQTDILREEKSELLSTIESLRNELDDRTRYGEELESTIKSSSATLEGLQQSVSEKDRHVTELEENLMTMEENFQQERDTLKQEVTALQFQNSAEQIQYEHALQVRLTLINTSNCGERITNIIHITHVPVCSTTTHNANELHENLY